MKKQINSAFKAYILLAFAIAFLPIVNAANATCPDGTERPCIINGKHGTQTCTHSGWGPCVPEEETPSPTPTFGTVQSRDVGPTTQNFSSSDLNQSVSGRILSLAVSAD